jgi:Carboxypeptidase regulatory-like domain
LLSLNLKFMKIRPWLFIALFITTGVSCLAQDSTFLFRAVSKLKLQPGTEKVYLHLDKPSYYPGDTIWYKAYVLTGAEHKLSGLSGVLEVELINSKDSVISRQTLRIVAGLAWSEFVLPRKIPGIYHIRAYTNWMRNQGPASFYFTSIQAGGSVQPVPPKQLAAEPHIDVQFFPEGGELVSGLRSRVAFKAVNNNGAGEDIKGTVEDNDGNVVADIATQHLGMGVFALMPQAGKTYHAVITKFGETSYTVNLPPVRDAGFTLSVDNKERDSIFIKIAVNDKLFSGKQNSVFYLVAQSGGRVYYTTEGKLASPVFAARVARSRFPSGIVQFTLFSQEGEPINERLAFVMNDDTMKMKLTNVASSYAPRQKVSIGIESHPGEKDSLIGSFSVSVINESRVFVNETAESTILNNILVTSELKGYIEQPNYYFTNINGQKQADLDVLMLTQGYRRFEWKKVLGDTVEPIIYQPQQGLELDGTLKTPSGKPVPNGKVTFAATRDGVVTDTTTDVDGNFRFTNLNVSDTAKIVLRARKEHNSSNVAIFVKQPDYPLVVKNTKDNIRIADSITPEMQKNINEYREQRKQDSLKNGIVLKEVVIKGKKAPKPDTYNGYGTSYEYDVDMRRLNGENTVKDALPMIIPGAWYQLGKITYDFNPVTLIIDGLVQKGDQIDYYAPREIDNIRMIDATNMRPAMLVITTKRFAGTDTASTTLKEVVIKAHRTVKAPDLSQSQSLHQGAADQVIMEDQMGPGIDLSDRLNGRAFGVSFKSNGSPMNNRNRGGMSVIVDGNVLSSGSLNNINSNDVYSIEVLRSGAARSIYGTSIEAGGALVITMKHGGENKYLTSADPAGLITYRFNGYHRSRVFYSPKYDHPKTETETFDSRSTIYWNPNIITGKDGKASFEYYNADTKGTYRVVIEGIDEEGRLGRAVYRYQVQ